MKFLEKSLETDETYEVPDADEGEETATPKQAEDREMFECVICGQTAPSTDDKPIGMVALMQTTGVLGHRSQVSETQILPTHSGEEITHAGRCRNVNPQRKLDLVNNFDKGSVQTSVNIGWHGGVHIQSCRHYIHLSCHESYIKSLQRQEYQSPHLHVQDKGEYECPLCRQLANFVLPCIPLLESHATERQRVPDQNHATVASEVMEKLLQTKETQGLHKGIITASRNVVLRRLVKEHKLEKYPFGQSRLSVDHMEMLHILLQSTARVNVELDLVVRGNLLASQSPSQSSAKRSCLGTLLEVISILTEKTFAALATKSWSTLTRVQQESHAVVPRGSKNEVPILLKDPVAVFLQLITAMQHPITVEHFMCIVRALYVLQYIQALSVISCRMPEAERKAWTQSGKTCQDYSNQIRMQSLLSQVIVMYSQSRLYEEADMYEGLAICQSVWTPQCIETAIQQYCLPFLRTAALIQHHLYREELPACQRQDVEFEVLVNFLNLCTAPPVDEKQPNLYSARCLHFAGGSPSVFLTAWCQEFLVFVNKNHKVAKNLLLYNPIFHPPCLLQLPTSYNDIFQYYRQRRCDKCRAVADRPAVCLVCGALICLNVDGLGCQRASMLTALETKHSLACGAGTAVYLDVNSSAVIIIRGERLCYWASVYLDRHGEEDRELKRGKPLFLCLQRYKVLEHLWRSHGFNHCCKNWLWHGAINH